MRVPVSRRLVNPIQSCSRRAHSTTRNVYGLAAQVASKPAAPAYVAEQPKSSPKVVDPFELVSSELSYLRTNLISLLGSTDPGLAEIAKYYFMQPSKQLRPLLVLLFAKATNGLGVDWQKKSWSASYEGARGLQSELDAPLSRADVLNDWNPSLPEHTASFQEVFNLIPVPRPPVPTQLPPFASSSFQPHVENVILPTQIRLAQIAEMIHVASLLHDDVIDTSPLRRGVPSGPAAFGNKLTILGGDFLLGRASAALSRLGETEVVELVSSIIANLVEGEVMQAREAYQQPAANVFKRGSSPASPSIQKDGEKRVSQHQWNVYVKKTYLKTASLIAKTARSSVVLGGSRDGEIWKEVAYAYGRNLGIAFQVS